MTISEEIIAGLIPDAIRWVMDYEQYALKRGRELNERELVDARLAWVEKPEEIRVCSVPHIPRPDGTSLATVNTALGLITADTKGLTAFYGVFLRGDAIRDRELLVHECVHVAQFERQGGIEQFLRAYLKECRDEGYDNAPLELEARERAALICGSGQRVFEVLIRLDKRDAGRCLWRVDGINEHSPRLGDRLLEARECEERLCTLLRDARDLFTLEPPVELARRISEELKYLGESLAENVGHLSIEVPATFARALGLTLKRTDVAEWVKEFHE